MSVRWTFGRFCRRSSSVALSAVNAAAARVASPRTASAASMVGSSGGSSFRRFLAGGAASVFEAEGEVMLCGAVFLWSRRVSVAVAIVMVKVLVVVLSGLRVRFP